MRRGVATYYEYHLTYKQVCLGEQGNVEGT
ncbi:hypothetical protein DET54_1134 [Paenibacillus pabuli]|uniref:Uncharacterized protein n=1 Tax=Paenibacillus pabuli TaxID=1472 RepID=A0A855XYR6_9BACL|nr:hypothetical protein DET56_107364 [Paenibacillus pabuli]PXW06147.1 hypothetical protein DEU73_107364 [Paenibacillus taichungensis]RAI89721.1 hypothetical protein DET54_1134 [Paenibacillus pabuli]